MAKGINMDKIYSELAKGTPSEMFAALTPIKSFVQKELEKEQAEVEDRNNNLSEKIQALNGK